MIRSEEALVDVSYEEEEDESEEDEENNLKLTFAQSTPGNNNNNNNDNSSTTTSTMLLDTISKNFGFEFEEEREHRPEKSCNPPLPKPAHPSRRDSNRMVSRVRNISELKKIAPKVKLLAREITSLSELTKANSQNQESLSTSSAAARPKEGEVSHVENAKNHLNKYCRTCAGLKIPLVDIFSEKGVQMRLEQQMKHLEEVRQQDGLSTQMCMDCICDLKMSYKFFMQIKKAQVKLKSIHATLKDSLSGRKEATNNGVLIKAEDQQISIQNQQQRQSQSQSQFAAGGNLLLLQKEDTAEANNEENEDSIEEFDPEDHVEIPPESSDWMESEMEFAQSPNNVLLQRKPENSSTLVTYSYEERPTGCTIKKEQQQQQQQHMNLDLDLNLNSKLTQPEINAVNPGDTEVSIIMENVEPVKREEKPRENQKHPNILKKKMPMTQRKSIDAVNITHTDQDGIMYVTVKGSKPNELLLVKVKKMDKNVNQDTKPKEVSVPTKFDIKPVEKILRRYESLVAKEKDLFPERGRKSDIREQIIEEQIEEYKKKREMLLGSGVKIEACQPRYIRQNDPPSPEPERETNGVGAESNLDNSGTGENALVKNEPMQSHDFEENIVYMELEDEGMELEQEQERKVEDERDQDEVENIEDVDRIDVLRAKWGESPNIKEDEPEDEPSSILLPDGNDFEEDYQMEEPLEDDVAIDEAESNRRDLEKLTKVLGEKDEPMLTHFQEYLKHRKIVVPRLKDEDIRSLFNKVRAAAGETWESIELPEKEFECDYCLETFESRETLEEHEKVHDFRLMHFCEDCGQEFPTNKAKRCHNVTCIKKLLCKYCNTLLDSKGKKRQHEQKHCDSIYGQLCEVCGEKFKHQGTLDQHYKTQHMNWEKVFQCPMCPKKFAFKQKLSFHLKSVHTTLRAYLCEDCGADFKNPASLRHHRIRKHQPIGNKRECPVCHKMVPFYSLSKHMHTHKAYSIQCPQCEKMFKNTSTLKQHVRIHEDQRQYRCDTCGVGFNRRDGLRLHMRVHQKSDSRGLKECSCQVCGEKFPNHSMLVIHRNRVHKDGRQYTCHICNRSMISTRSLDWHMSHIHGEVKPELGFPLIPKPEFQEEIITPDKEPREPSKDTSTGASGGGSSPSEKKRVACYHCNKTFKTEMILRTHIKNTHVEKDRMKCLDCEETFTSDVRLRHHMMVAHNRLEGTLECPHCPKRFVNQLRLKTHLISHSEERPYTCEICGFNLKTKIQLIKHHQNRHSDERPLQCRYCPWRCKQVSALVCHERTHTNERPYSCVVCRQRFKYLGDKNKHERRHESLGGSGFKRIVSGRNAKPIKNVPEEDGEEEEEEENSSEVVSCSYPEEPTFVDGEMVKFEADGKRELMEEEEEEEEEEEYEEDRRGNENEGGESRDSSGGAPGTNISTQGCPQMLVFQEYEETSREASEAAEVIMNMEDTIVYTEEVTADNIEGAEMITDEIMSNQILQSGTVVHLQQQDDTGKIQVIPVMLSLPNLTDANAEVNLATASIMYNN